MLDRMRDDRTRLRLETGPGGDKDVPYRFEMPWDWRVVDYWIRLTARWARGEFTLDIVQGVDDDENRSRGA
jgi:hypothetical protein